MSDRIIEIAPRPGSKVTGNYRHSGPITHKQTREVIHEFLGATPFQIPGDGCVLNLDNPDQKLIYDCIINGREVAAFFGPGKRFEIVDHQKQDREQIEFVMRRTKVHKYLESLLDEKRIIPFGKIIGKYGNTDESTYAKLLMYSDTPEGCDKIERWFKHADRDIAILIQLALEQGDHTEKEGLYKRPGSEVYYWNEAQIGLGEQSVVTWLKNPENKDVYEAMKSKFIPKASKK